MTAKITNIFLGIGDFVKKTSIITGIEVLKLRHDPSELFTRAIQPVLWLVIFGEVFNQVRVFPTGSTPYIDFLTPGILAQSSMFVAIFSGMAIIWERDLGIVHKYLAAPVPRGALALGKALSGGIRALSQAIIVYVIAFILGVHLNWNPLALAWGSAGFDHRGSSFLGLLAHYRPYR